MINNSKQRKKNLMENGKAPMPEEMVVAPEEKSVTISEMERTMRQMQQGLLQVKSQLEYHEAQVKDLKENISRTTGAIMVLNQLVNSKQESKEGSESTQ